MKQALSKPDFISSANGGKALLSRRFTEERPDMRKVLVLIAAAALSACGSPGNEPGPVTTDEAQALQKAGEMLNGLETPAPSVAASEGGE